MVSLQNLSDVIDSDGFEIALKDIDECDIENITIREKWGIMRRLMMEILKSLPKPSDDGYAGKENEPFDEEYQ